MSDTKISGLTALAGSGVDASADLLPIVDTSVTTTKKISYQNLMDAANTLDTAVAASVSAVGDMVPIFISADSKTKKLSYQGFMNSLNNLATLASASVSSAADFIPIYNVQDAATKKVKLSDAIKINLATEQASTSGTAINFTGIPSGTRRITVMLVGVSTNGTSNVIIQIGDSGGIETTGYNTASGWSDGGGAGGTSTTAIWLSLVAAAAANLYGHIILTLEDSSDNTWMAHGTVHAESAFINTSVGSKALSAELDRVRITTVNGTDTFDAGVINIAYE